MSEQPNEATFALQRIYVRDLSFESPKAPNAFRGPWKPKVNLDLNSHHGEIEEGLYEVVLHLTATTRNEEEEVLYLAEVQQAGVFLIRGLDGAMLDQTLGSFCPNVLFPYAREAIDSLVTRGSFPPLMLAPVNFDALYEQTRQQRNGQKPTIQ
ncbi:MAG: protein-export chaperone SecB [Pseudomonadales bacterium]|nr:protein-export chaperone SecB [Pseudomonadales bacterium]